ncbi:MAG TPA: dockerin type I domain-containing protein, partial [Methylomirabilota bacterium]|nr:dockerin type I domain-containing protein [Methylomirabilota bacterium]
LSFNITDAESRSGSGSFTLNVQSAPCWDETANGGGDAGEFTTNPQTTTGSGTLCSIAGTLGASDADLYVIEICDAANFLATTSNSYTTFDTQLWLFQLNGAGVVANDDDPLGGLTSRITSTFIPGNGTYLLGISRYNRDPLSETGQLMWNNTPFNVERTPDGPGAGGTLSSWTGTTTGGASYRIFLTGACFPGPSCDPDVNCDGSADGFDVEAMEQAVGGDMSNFCQADADFNGDGSVDGFDVESVEQVVGGAPCP